jgi:peptidoglycan hydrolase-like protein with peptidoglycan-binding domain
MRNLSTSARGADVLFLQRMLNKRGAKPQLAEDGIFGPRTQHAVTAFQNTNRIGPPHGVADRRLWARFGAIVEYEHRV